MPAAASTSPQWFHEEGECVNSCSVSCCCLEDLFSAVGTCSPWCALLHRKWLFVCLAMQHQEEHVEAIVLPGKSAAEAGADGKLLPTTSDPAEKQATGFPHEFR